MHVENSDNENLVIQNVYIQISDIQNSYIQDSDIQNNSYIQDSDIQNSDIFSTFHFAHATNLHVYVGPKLSSGKK